MLRGRADDRHRVHHPVGHEPGRAVAVARLKRLTDAVGFAAEADPLHVLVIEDAHASSPHDSPMVMHE